MWILVALGLLLAQEQRPLAVTYDEATFQPIVHIGGVLQDSELERAALSGLPVRVRVRIELWKDRFFDQLIDSAGWSTTIVYEPIGEQFLVRILPGPQAARRFTTFATARRTVENEFRPRMGPLGGGRYYYTASLQIETLSLSDLEELERWLQGELQPAVSGQRSVPAAVGQGAKRLMLRILDLPARRYDARTARFRMP